MTDDNVTDIVEARRRRATARVRKALAGLTDDEKRQVVEQALLAVGGDLKVDDLEGLR